MKLRHRRWICLVYPLLMVLSACAEKKGSDPSRVLTPEEQKQQIQSAVTKIQSGQLVQDINAKQESLAVPAPSPSAPPSDSRAESKEPGPSARPTPVADLGMDSCPEAPYPDVNAAREEKEKALRAIWACVDLEVTESFLVGRAIEYFSNFRSAPEAPALSSLTARELYDFLKVNWANPMEYLAKPDPKREDLIRNHFTETDLKELQLLQIRKEALLKSILDKTLRLMSNRAEFFDSLASLNDRYEALRIYRKTAERLALKKDYWERVQVLNEFQEGLNRVLTKSREELAALENLHVGAADLYQTGISSLIPSPDLVLGPLAVNQGEHPYVITLNEVGLLMGTDRNRRNNLLDIYDELRKSDNPKLPYTPPAPTNAVGVAVLDSGIDFVTFPELAPFVTHPAPEQEAELTGWDYSDADANPYMPFVNDLSFSHGTGVSATVLSIISQQAPDLLESRGIVLLPWKNATIRDVLSLGAKGSGHSWSSRPFAYFEALVRNAEGTRKKPRIVSISAQFNTQIYLEWSKRSGLFTKAPWLWVMAAGNDGVDAKDSVKGLATCLQDLPAAERNADQILCVGALKRGIVRDQIAFYSNYGEAVDVYTWESFIEHCPNGTSCATPAISAAAAIIQAKYPQLTPAQLKRVIVEASTEKEVETSPDPRTDQTATSPESQKKPLKRVKIFNPNADIPKALEIAKGIR